MSSRLILPLSENTNIKKDRLINTLNEIAAEVNTIHELYEKFFNSNGNQPSLARQIEKELEDIKAKYSTLFEPLEVGGSSKVAELDQEIEKIKQFHQDLLDGENSIQADIKDSQDKITDFYVKLFQTYETKGDGGQEAKLKAAFQSIISFDEDLNKADVGYRTKLNQRRAKYFLHTKSCLLKIRNPM